MIGYYPRGPDPSSLRPPAGGGRAGGGGNVWVALLVASPRLHRRKVGGGHFGLQGGHFRRLKCYHESYITASCGSSGHRPGPSPTERARRTPRRHHGRGAHACPGGHERPHRARRGSAQPRLRNRSATAIIAMRAMHVTPVAVFVGSGHGEAAAEHARLDCEPRAQEGHPERSVREVEGSLFSEVR